MLKARLGLENARALSGIPMGFQASQGQRLPPNYSSHDQIACETTQQNMHQARCGIHNEPMYLHLCMCVSVWLCVGLCL